MLLSPKSGRINRKTEWVFLTVGVNQGKIRVAKLPKNDYVVPQGWVRGWRQLLNYKFYTNFFDLIWCLVSNGVGVERERVCW